MVLILDGCWFWDLIDMIVRMDGIGFVWFGRCFVFGINDVVYLLCCMMTRINTDIIIDIV